MRKIVTIIFEFALGVKDTPGTPQRRIRDTGVAACMFEVAKRNAWR